MAIQYKQDNSGLRTDTAVERANEMLRVGSDFMLHYTQPEFKNFVPDMADTSLLDILLTMQAYLLHNRVEVKHWKPWNRWTKAIAMTKGKAINLNVRKMYRPIGDIIATLVHEIVHIVDIFMPNMSFGHGNNYKKGKEKTAPYLLQRLAKEYYESGKLYTVKELQAL